jgi:hypothetical protein
MNWPSAVYARLDNKPQLDGNTRLRWTHENAENPRFDD